MIELFNSDPAFVCVMVTCNENWIHSKDAETIQESFQFKHAGSRSQEDQTDLIHVETFWWPFYWKHGHDLHSLDSYWTVNKEHYAGFKGVQEAMLSEEVRIELFRTEH